MKKIFSGRWIAFGGNGEQTLDNISNEKNVTIFSAGNSNSKHLKNINNNFFISCSEQNEAGDIQRKLRYSVRILK